MGNRSKTLTGEYAKTSRAPRMLEAYKGHKFYIQQFTGLGDGGDWSGVFEDVQPGYECTRYQRPKEKPARSEQEARERVIKWIDFCEQMIAWSRSQPRLIT